MTRRSPSSRSPAPLFRMLEGGQRLDPERVAAHQRARLEGAMVEAVARHGYKDVTVSELVSLAGVSKATLYKHFTGKEDCFLATFEAIAEISAADVRDANQSAREGGFEDQLRAAFSAFAEIVIANPAATALALIDSAALGEAAISTRERAAGIYERMISQSFETGPGAIDAATVRAIVGGMQRIVYRRLREGDPEQLRDDVEGLVAWAASYAPDRSAGAGSKPEHPPAPPQIDVPEPPVPWEEPPNSPRSRRELDHRERIVRAVVRITAERGYGELTIPIISSVAGISNQTFYERFSSKEEAFLAAFQDLADVALEASRRYFKAAPSWEEGVLTGLGALVAFLAASPPFARLTFVELPVAGRAAIGVADRQVEMFTSLLTPPPELAERYGASSQLVIDAIGGAVWALIQHEVVRGRVNRLPRLAPTLAEMVVRPYSGASGQR